MFVDVMMTDKISEPERIGILPLAYRRLTKQNGNIR